MKLKTNPFKYKLSVSENFWKRYLQSLVVLLILSAILGAIMMVLTVVSGKFYLSLLLILDLRVFLLNIIPIFLAMMIIYCIVNRVWLSFALVSVVGFVIAEVNRFKMSFRDDPFVFEDILLFSEAKKMTESYSLYIDIVSFVSLAFLIYTAFVCRKNLQIKIKNLWVRLCSGVLAVMLLIFSCQTLYFDNNKLYKALWNPLFGSEYKAGDQSTSHGVIYSFLKSIPQAFSTPPIGYDDINAENILSNYETVDIPEDKKVHVISIMLEAYSDFSKFDGVEFDVDPYKNFHKLQRSSYSGKLYTNIFAASTVYTERQFITGYNDMRFSQKNTESYARYFKSQGYYTEAMHPGYGWFYNRNNMNNFLGFDNFEYLENKYSNIPEDELISEKYWEYISDPDFMNQIIKGYERAMENEQKYFNFSVTVQNHAPYPEKAMTEVEYLKKKAEYPENFYNVFNNYLSGISKTDGALQTLREYIDSQSEPIVLILFGDHKPRLGNEDEVYNMLGINLDNSTPEGAENYYGTDYLFYANSAAKKALGKRFVGTGNTISPIFIMNELFEYIGLKGPAYMNYMSDVKKEFEVINKTYLRQNDKYIPASENADNDVLREQKIVEYYVKNREIEIVDEQENDIIEDIN